MQVKSNLTAEKVARLQRRRQCKSIPGSAILELLQLRSISCPAIIPHYVTIIKLWLDYRIVRAN